MDQEDMAHVYSGILAIRRNEIGSFLDMWMDLETVIQSEVSPKEKNKFHILMHIFGSQKNSTDDQFAGQKLRHICRKQTYGHQRGKVAGGVGDGVMNWEIGIDMYKLMCIKWMTNKNLLYKKINNIKI